MKTIGRFILMGHISDSKKELPGHQVRRRSNRYIPTAPVLSTPEEKLVFIKLLQECDGYEVRAAEKFGCSTRTVRRRKSEDPEFAKAVEEVRWERDQRNLADLATLSLERARDPKNVTERIFNLNALDPGKYRPKPQAPQLPPLTINFGVRIPKLPGMGSQEVPADAEVVPTKVEAIPEESKPKEDSQDQLPYSPDLDADEFSVGDIEL